MNQLTDIQMQQIFFQKEDGYVFCLICNKQQPVFDDNIQSAFWRHHAVQYHQVQLIKAFLDNFRNNKNDQQKQTESFDEDIVIELFDPIDPPINLVQKYFEEFINLLIKKNFLDYAICFYLGRIGKSISVISSIKLKQIQREIQDIQENHRFTHLHSLGNKIDSILNEKFRQNVYLFQQPYLPKRLSQGLTQLRHLMGNEFADQEWKQFLQNLRIKSLNSLFFQENHKYSNQKNKKILLKE